MFDVDKDDGFTNIRRQVSGEFEKCTAIAALRNLLQVKYCIVSTVINVYTLFEFLSR